MKSFLIGILALGYFTSFGQAVTNDRTVAYYQPDPILAGEQIQFIEVNFNAFELNTEIPQDIKSLTIERIDLVYSTYKENSDFDQKKLNTERIGRFISAWPEAKNPLIIWNVVGQSGATNRRDARSLFHGFVVYYREKPTVESMKRELNLIDAYLTNGVFPAEQKELPSASESERLSGSIASKNEIGSPEIEDGLISEYVVKRESTFSESDLKIARELGKTRVAPIEGEHARVNSLRVAEYQNECYTSYSGVFNGKSTNFEFFLDSLSTATGYSYSIHSYNHSDENKATECYYVLYTLKKECDTLPDSYGVIDFYNPASWDCKEFNAVQATFERHPNWQNTQIIMDVTGSMAPYIAKTMAWIKATQKSSQVRAFTFFNDGNEKKDYEKRVGSVGGIYGVVNIDYDAVYNVMSQTMDRGGGGDCPENNVEATLWGLKQFPNCDEIVMVADNWATPRDLSLLKEVKVPVHVIVCGGDMGINVSFIQLAYETKGSVHTIEEDLDARAIVPGKQFQIGRTYFTLIDDKIVSAEHK